MRVLADLHHRDLFYSLQLLFEKRLGCEFYRPIGMEWYHEGFWAVFPHVDTAGQYLGLYQASTHPKDIHGNLLPKADIVNYDYRVEDGIYYVRDHTKDEIHRAITLAKFKEMEFDLLISSIPQHIPIFNELIRQFQPKAKHIFQVGNAWGHQLGVKNILASTAQFPVPSDINVCFYHQEFDLRMFRYEPPKVRNGMYSYIHYMQKPELMDAYRALLPGWDIKAYGGGMPQSIPRTDKLASQMINSALTWHYKPEGDGYGHVAHNSLACGRPLVIWKPFYKGKMLEPLLIDGSTCIDASRGTTELNAKRILQCSQPEEHNRMCLATYRRFKEVVDFDEEEVRVRKFVERLV